MDVRQLEFEAGAFDVAIDKGRSALVKGYTVLNLTP